jgi:hypothetical protein
MSVCLWDCVSLKESKERERERERERDIFCDQIWKCFDWSLDVRKKRHLIGVDRVNWNLHFLKSWGHDKPKAKIEKRKGNLIELKALPSSNNLNEFKQFLLRRNNMEIYNLLVKFHLKNLLIVTHAVVRWFCPYKFQLCFIELKIKLENVTNV